MAKIKTATPATQPGLDLATPSTRRLPNSAPPNPGKPRSGLEDVREAIAVLSVRCTPPQHLAPMAARLLEEWTLDLQVFEPSLLIAAVRAYGDTDRGRKGFWPSLGEVKSLCVSITGAQAIAEATQAVMRRDWADDHPETWAKVKQALGGAQWTCWLALCTWDQETNTLICPNSLVAERAEWRCGAPIRVFVGRDVKFGVKQ
jgi:hypothetical protein